MSIPKKILMVGTVDIMDVLSALTELDILIAANYAEAITKMGKTKFDRIITDAVLPDQKSGLDILYYTRNTLPEAKVVVCHPEESCYINNRTWYIASFLKAHFPKAVFMKKSASRHLSELLPLRKCA